MVKINETQLREIQSNIIGIGRTNKPPDLTKIYSSADVFFTQHLEEAMILTIFKAIAYETIFINYDSWG